MSEEKFTLREAQERVDEIVKEIAPLLGVAALDLEDTGFRQESRALSEVFDTQLESGGTRTNDVAFKFARQLVERIIGDGPLGFTWDEEEGP